MTVPETQLQAQTRSIYRHAITRGVVLGLLAILLITAAYLMNYKIIASFKFLGPFLLLCIGVVVVSGVQFRNENGGYLSYQNAFFHGFIMLAMYGVISTLFYITLYNVIDPELPGKLTDEFIANMPAVVAAGDADVVSQARADLANNFTPAGLLWNLAKSTVGFAFISAITALIVRKNVPIKA